MPAASARSSHASIWHRVQVPHERDRRSRRPPFDRSAISRTQAALTLGFSPFDLARYVLAPACLRPVLAASGGLLVEILALDMALTLFGFGSPPPSPTLGTLLADGLRYFSTAPWMALVPLAVVCCLCVSLRALFQRGDH